MTQQVMGPRGVERWIAGIVPVVLVLWALTPLAMGGPEPYPVPVMPGFGAVPNVDETFRWSSIELEVRDADGRSHAVSGSDLMAEIPLLTSAVLGHAFSSADSGGGVPRAQHPDTKAWLRERLAALLPGVEPVEVTLYRQRWVTAVEGGTHSRGDRGTEVHIDLKVGR